MRTIGRTLNVNLGQGNSALALVPIASEKDRLVLGQFVFLGRLDEQTDSKLILGKVLEIQPDFGETNNYREAVRDTLKGRELDNFYKRELGFLTYKIKLLGVVSLGKEFKFYSDVRYFPPIHELDVLIPSSAVMKQLMRSAALSAEDDPVEFELGDLSYGSDPENTQSYVGENRVPVVINVKNMLRRRTAVLGQSGYGKSNLVKAIVGMIAKEAKNAGQLLLDTNGEYSLTNSQNDGFLDIFHEAGMQDKVLVFTNRNMQDSVKHKFSKNLRPLKIDAYSEPSTVFTIVAESVRKQLRNDELPKYLVKWVLGAETEDNQSCWDSVTRKGLVWAMYYAALANEGIRPAAENKRCEVGTFVDAQYLTYLISGGGSDMDPGQSVNDVELKEEDLKALAAHHNIIKRNGRFYTNSVETMINYGKWFAETKASEDTELKDFKDLVTDKSYRLSAIKKLHIQNQSEISQGLAYSVFRSLKDGKIVILDLALEGVKVADVLTRHILNYIFNKMSEDFSKPELRAEFSKRDILVYLEESQNYLSEKNVGEGSIYERIAKEGRKFNIGLVYITQQPTAISQSITSQTENIFALHLSNEKDTLVLKAIKDKFDDLTCRFLKDEAVKGLCYVYMEPYMPFTLPVMVRLFNKELILGKRK